MKRKKEEKEKKEKEKEKEREDKKIYIATMHAYRHRSFTLNLWLGTRKKELCLGNFKP